MQSLIDECFTCLDQLQPTAAVMYCRALLGEMQQDGVNEERTAAFQTWALRLTAANFYNSGRKDLHYAHEVLRIANRIWGLVHATDTASAAAAPSATQAPPTSCGWHSD